ncbi:hypothetical protein G4B88_018006 [Cannabis sativa]|uniref:Uncharacterized protein n=1 Tax=Cannabis sativa TaxID=3483 RepID=A0A7J6HIN0_CANSA|nr:hypothetical protein G4B88_018006 [Cannabis sativa]
MRVPVESIEAKYSLLGSKPKPVIGPLCPLKTLAIEPSTVLISLIPSSSPAAANMVPDLLNARTLIGRVNRSNQKSRTLRTRDSKEANSKNIIGRVRSHISNKVISTIRTQNSIIIKKKNIKDYIRGTVITRKLVELDGMINRAGSEAGGVGAKSEGSNSVAVVAEELGSGRRKKGVVDGDGWVGRRSGDQVVGLLVPQHRAKRRASIAGSFVSFSQLHGTDFHDRELKVSQVWLCRVVDLRDWERFWRKLAGMLVLDLAGEYVLGVIKFEDPNLLEILAAIRRGGHHEARETFLIMIPTSYGKKAMAKGSVRRIPKSWRFFLFKDRMKL